jgi:hypothetical protein
MPIRREPRRLLYSSKNVDTSDSEAEQQPDQEGDHRRRDILNRDNPNRNMMNHDFSIRSVGSRKSSGDAGNGSTNEEDSQQPQAKIIRLDSNPSFYSSFGPGPKTTGKFIVYCIYSFINFSLTDIC